MSRPHEDTADGGVEGNAPRLRTSSRGDASRLSHLDRIGVSEYARSFLDVATLCEVPVLRSTSRRTDPSAFFKDPSRRGARRLISQRKGVTFFFSDFLFSFCPFSPLILSLELPPKRHLRLCCVFYRERETKCHPAAGASLRPSEIRSISCKSCFSKSRAISSAVQTLRGRELR